MTRQGTPWEAREAGISSHRWDLAHLPWSERLASISLARFFMQIQVPIKKEGENANDLRDICVHLEGPRHAQWHFWISTRIWIYQKLLSGFDWSVCMHPLLIKNGHGKSHFFADDFPFKCSIAGDFRLPCLIRRVAHIYTGCGIPHSWSVIIPNTSWSVQSLMSPRIINQPLLKSIHLFGGYEKTLLRHGCMAPCDRCQSSLLARLSCQLLKWILIF